MSEIALSATNLEVMESPEKKDSQNITEKTRSKIGGFFGRMKDSIVDTAKTLNENTFGKIDEYYAKVDAQEKEFNEKNNVTSDGKLLTENPGLWLKKFGTIGLKRIVLGTGKIFEAVKDIAVEHAFKGTKTAWENAKFDDNVLAVLKSDSVSINDVKTALQAMGQTDMSFVDEFADNPLQLQAFARTLHREFQVRHETALKNEVTNIDKKEEGDDLFGGGRMESNATAGETENINIAKEVGKAFFKFPLKFLKDPGKFAGHFAEYLTATQQAKAQNRLRKEDFAKDLEKDENFQRQIEIAKETARAIQDIEDLDQIKNNDTKGEIYEKMGNIPFLGAALRFNLTSGRWMTTAASALLGHGGMAMASVRTVINRATTELDKQQLESQDGSPDIKTHLNNLGLNLSWEQTISMIKNPDQLMNLVNKQILIKATENQSKEAYQNASGVISKLQSIYSNQEAFVGLMNRSDQQNALFILKDGLNNLNESYKDNAQVSERMENKFSTISFKSDKDKLDKLLSRFGVNSKDKVIRNILATLSRSVKNTIKDPETMKAIASSLGFAMTGMAETAFLDGILSHSEELVMDSASGISHALNSDEAFASDGHNVSLDHSVDVMSHSYLASFVHSMEAAAGLGVSKLVVETAGKLKSDEVKEPSNDFLAKEISKEEKIKNGMYLKSLEYLKGQEGLSKVQDVLTLISDKNKSPEDIVKQLKTNPSFSKTDEKVLQDFVSNWQKSMDTNAISKIKESIQDLESGNFAKLPDIEIKNLGNIDAAYNSKEGILVDDSGNISENVSHEIFEHVAAQLHDGSIENMGDVGTMMHLIANGESISDLIVKERDTVTIDGKEFVAKATKGSWEDATVKEGEGIIHAIARQLQTENQNLTPKEARIEASKLAVKFGYIDQTTGNDVRVKYADKVAYQVEFNNQGEVVKINESFRDSVDDNKWEDNSDSESHEPDSKYEGKDIDKYEYENKGGTSDDKGHGGSGANDDVDKDKGRGEGEGKGKGKDKGTDDIKDKDKGTEDGKKDQDIEKKEQNGDDTDPNKDNSTPEHEVGKKIDIDIDYKLDFDKKIPDTRFGPEFALSYIESMSDDTHPAWNYEMIKVLSDRFNTNKQYRDALKLTLEEIPISLLKENIFSTIPKDSELIEIIVDRISEHDNGGLITDKMILDLINSDTSHKYEDEIVTLIENCQTVELKDLLHSGKAFDQDIVMTITKKLATDGQKYIDVNDIKEIAQNSKNDEAVEILLESMKGYNITLDLFDSIKGKEKAGEILANQIINDYYNKDRYAFIDKAALKAQTLDLKEAGILLLNETYRYQTHKYDTEYFVKDLDEKNIEEKVDKILDEKTTNLELVNKICETYIANSSSKQYRDAYKNLLLNMPFHFLTNDIIEQIPAKDKDILDAVTERMIEEKYDEVNGKTVDILVNKTETDSQNAGVLESTFKEMDKDLLLPSVIKIQDKKLPEDPVNTLLDRTLAEKFDKITPTHIEAFKKICEKANNADKYEDLVDNITKDELILPLFANIPNTEDRAAIFEQIYEKAKESNLMTNSKFLDEVKKASDKIENDYSEEIDEKIKEMKEREIKKNTPKIETPNEDNQVENKNEENKVEVNPTNVETQGEPVNKDKVETPDENNVVPKQDTQVDTKTVGLPSELTFEELDETSDAWKIVIDKNKSVEDKISALKAILKDNKKTRINGFEFERIGEDVFILDGVKRYKPSEANFNEIIKLNSEVNTPKIETPSEDNQVENKNEENKVEVNPTNVETQGEPVNKDKVEKESPENLDVQIEQASNNPELITNSLVNRLLENKTVDFETKVKPLVENMLIKNIDQATFAKFDGNDINHRELATKLVQKIVLKNPEKISVDFYKNTAGNLLDKKLITEDLYSKILYFMPIQEMTEDKLSGDEINNLIAKVNDPTIKKSFEELIDLKINIIDKYLDSKILKNLDISNANIAPEVWKALETSKLLKDAIKIVKKEASQFDPDQKISITYQNNKYQINTTKGDTTTTKEIDSALGLLTYLGNGLSTSVFEDQKNADNQTYKISAKYGGTSLFTKEDLDFLRNIDQTKYMLELDPNNFSQIIDQTELKNELTKKYKEKNEQLKSAGKLDYEESQKQLDNYLIEGTSTAPLKILANETQSIYAFGIKAQINIPKRFKDSFKFEEGSITNVLTFNENNSNIFNNEELIVSFEDEKNKNIEIKGVILDGENIKLRLKDGEIMDEEYFQKIIDEKYKYDQDKISSVLKTGNPGSFDNTEVSLNSTVLSKDDYNFLIQIPNLKLKADNLTEIPDKLGENLISLEANSLTKLNGNDLPNLQEVKSTSLNSISGSFENLTKLNIPQAKELDAVCPKLETIDDCANLKSIDGQFNKLTQLTAPSLEEIDGACTDLTALNAPKLTELNSENTPNLMTLIASDKTTFDGIFNQLKSIKTSENIPLSIALDAKQFPSLNKFETKETSIYQKTINEENKINFTKFEVPSSYNVSSNGETINLLQDGKTLFTFTNIEARDNQKLISLEESINNSKLNDIVKLMPENKIVLENAISLSDYANRITVSENKLNIGGLEIENPKNLKIMFSESGPTFVTTDGDKESNYQFDKELKEIISFTKENGLLTYLSFQNKNIVDEKIKIMAPDEINRETIGTKDLVAMIEGRNKIQGNPIIAKVVNQELVFQSKSESGVIIEITKNGNDYTITEGENKITGTIVDDKNRLTIKTIEGDIIEVGRLSQEKMSAYKEVLNKDKDRLLNISSTIWKDANPAELKGLLEQMMPTNEKGTVIDYSNLPKMEVKDFGGFNVNEEAIYDKQTNTIFVNRNNDTMALQQLIRKEFGNYINSKITSSSDNNENNSKILEMMLQEVSVNENEKTINFGENKLVFPKSISNLSLDEKTFQYVNFDIKTNFVDLESLKLSTVDLLNKMSNENNKLLNVTQDNDGFSIDDDIRSTIARDLAENIFKNIEGKSFSDKTSYEDNNSPQEINFMIGDNVNEIPVNIIFNDDYNSIKSLRINNIDVALENTKKIINILDLIKYLENYSEENSVK